MTWLAKKKLEANVAAGFQPTKGFLNGHCNRRACQKPLIGEAETCSMEDHEFSTDGRIYYCMACADLFDQADRGSRLGFRITREARG